ncbi:hypothetical protein N8529_00150 [bacterium]|nr:hypothetical protein [bacterium]
MATIKSTFSLTATGGSKLSVSMSKEANSTIDREVALTAGEFVEVFNMDTAGALGTATPAANSLADYKQLVAYNAGNTPIELALKTPFIDDADGAIHAELYSYPVFFIPVGGYLVLPSPRMVSLSGTLTTPIALNYVTDETKMGSSGRCVDQASLRATASTASYISNNKKVVKRGLSTAAITNSNGDLNIANLHGLANYNNDSGGGGSASTYVATDGIVPGTLRVHFYEPAFAEFNFTKNGIAPQTSASSTLLAVNTAYNIGLNVNGGGAADVTFTTHTSDVTWGSPTTGTGVLYKIQAAMDAAERECDVSIVDGNIRFTSRSRNSTSSAIAIAGASGGGNDFKDHGVMSAGYIEATAVQVLDDDDADVMFDNGNGVISRANGGSGVIGYGIPGSGTGVIAPLYITGAPANSSIKLSWLHGSSSGGNLSTTTPTDNADASNSLLSVYARALSYAAEHGSGGRKGKLRLVVVDNQEYSSANY